MRFYREHILEHLKLVASAEAQLEYERTVPIADVPAELIEGFPFHPKSPDFIDSFTEDELKDIAQFYGWTRIASEAFKKAGGVSVTDFLKLPEWRDTMAFAKDLHARLTR